MVKETGAVLLPSTDLILPTVNNDKPDAGSHSQKRKRAASM